MTSIKFSIIFLGYNSKGYIDKCLSSVLKTEYPHFEIIYVDNNSQDGSVEYVRKKYGNKIKILPLKKNYGYSGGNNRGARLATGDILIFLNPDTLVDKCWLKNLLKNFFNEKVGIVAPAIYNFYSKKIESLGGGFTNLGISYLKTKLDGKLPFWASGCCLIVRKKVFKKLKGFDENYFMYCEDVDLGWRCWGIGYKIICNPKCKIYHLGGLSVKSIKKKLFPFYYYYQTRNMLWTLIKNSIYSSIIFFRILLDFLQILTFFIKGKYDYSRAIIKGIIDGLKYKRKPVKNKYPYVLLDGFRVSLKAIWEEFKKHIINKI
jgi:hypothetical protein